MAKRQPKLYKSGELGARLREERQKTGFSQTDFADLANASLQSQTRYETGQTLPKLDYLFALAKHGVDVTFIMTGKRSNDAMSPNEQILLGYFNKLTPQNQQIVIGMTSALTGDRTGMEWAIQSDD